MNHSEALQQMATEKYLLNELSPEERYAFEMHFFECRECTFDLETAGAFLDEAEVELPYLLKSSPIANPQTASAQNRNVEAKSSGRTVRRSGFDWSWLRRLFASPAFAGPVFAALLVVIGYQNLVTFPALRMASAEPRLLASLVIHPSARGGVVRSEMPVLEADRKLGASILLDPGELHPYPADVFDLYDPQGKLAWTHLQEALASEPETGSGTGTGTRYWTLSIPGAALQQGVYRLAISGVDAAGKKTEIASSEVNIHFTN